MSHWIESGVLENIVRPDIPHLCSGAVANSTLRRWMWLASCSGCVVARSSVKANSYLNPETVYSSILMDSLRLRTRAASALEMAGFLYCLQKSNYFRSNRLLQRCWKRCWHGRLTIQSPVSLTILHLSSLIFNNLRTASTQPDLTCIGRFVPLHRNAFSLPKYLAELKPALKNPHPDIKSDELIYRQVLSRSQHCPLPVSGASSMIANGCYQEVTYFQAFCCVDNTSFSIFNMARSLHYRRLRQP